MNIKVHYHSIKNNFTILKFNKIMKSAFLKLFSQYLLKASTLKYKNNISAQINTKAIQKILNNRQKKRAFNLITNRFFLTNNR